MNFSDHPLTASAALLLSALFWGALVPMMWILLQVYDIWLLGVVRFTVALPFLMLFAWLWAREGLRRPLPWLRAAQLGLPMAGFAVFFNIGIGNSNPVTASIILICVPLIYTVIARVMVGTPLPPGFAVALMVSLAGGLLVVLGDPGSTGERFGLQGGEPFLLVAQVIWAWYSIRSQQWLGERGQIVLSLLPTAMATLYLLVAWIVLVASGVVSLPQRMPTVDETVFILWAGASGVAFAVVLWNYGVSRLDLPVASLHNNAIPVFATIAAMALGIMPTWQQLVGGVIVLAGVGYLQMLRVLESRR